MQTPSANEQETNQVHRKMHRKNQCSAIGHLSYRRNETESVELLPFARPNPTKSEKRNQLMQIQKGRRRRLFLNNNDGISSCTLFAYHKL